MKKARVFIQAYGGQDIGHIHDVVPMDAEKVLEGILQEVEVPDDFNKDIVTAVIAEDGSITFEEDASKVEAQIGLSRATKLSQLRKLREALLAEVDLMINDLALDDTALTQVQVKSYRQELKDVTEPYKNYASDEGHAAALDSLVVAEFTWPTKPS